MKKWIGKFLVTLLGGALLVYSAMRSLDFISLTLPADKQILAYFGLAALDGGLVFWLLSFLYGSSGGAQRGVSILMILVDFIGAVGMFTLDTLYNTGKAGMTQAMDANDLQSAVLALSLVIALNIAATVAHHILDPEQRKVMAEEEAFSKIEDMAIGKISENAQQLAAELAPQIAEDWMTVTRANYANILARGKNRKTASLPSLTQAAPPVIVDANVLRSFASTATNAGNLNMQAAQVASNDGIDGNVLELKPTENPTSRQRKAK